MGISRFLIGDKMKKELKISPEAMEVAQAHLQTMNIEQTAQALDLTQEEVSSYLGSKEVKRFIDNVFMEQGYNNRFKLTALLDTMVESKIEEAEDTGIYTSKDLLDILALQHKIVVEQAKLSQSHDNNTQINVQNNYGGGNLGDLMQKIIEGSKKEHL